MWELMRNVFVRRTFGGGFQGAIAERGIDWLSDEVRAALANEPETVETTRLRPGDTYTVIARPAYTRQERRLADTVEGLSAAEAKLTRTTPRQRKAARRLARAQKRLDRRRPGSRRYLKAKATEAARAQRFDRVMAPSKRLLRTRAELATASEQLERSKERSFAAARGRARTSSIRVHR